MTARRGWVRVGSGIVLVAVVAAVFLVGSPGDDEQDVPRQGASPPTATSPPPRPNPSSVTTEDFCSAFRAMAAAHAQHLAEDTEGSREELSVAAETVRRLEPGTVMPPGARQGLNDLVDGVLGVSAAAPDAAAADSLSTFLAVSCPAGGG